MHPAGTMAGPVGDGPWAPLQQADSHDESRPRRAEERRGTALGAKSASPASVGAALVFTGAGEPRGETRGAAGEGTRKGGWRVENWQPDVGATRVSGSARWAREVRKRIRQAVGTAGNRYSGHPSMPLVVMVATASDGWPLLH
ncbi:unnamed protein product [Prorocentrum cordatum]|nr:unnamed protein product [Polarella glacialis]